MKVKFPYFVILVGVLSVSPWYLSGRVYFGHVWLAVWALVAVWEWYSLKRKGVTLSTNFREWAIRNKSKAVGVFFATTTGWFALWGHLAFGW